MRKVAAYLFGYAGPNKSSDLGHEDYLDGHSWEQDGGVNGSPTSSTRAICSMRFTLANVSTIIRVFLHGSATRCPACCSSGRRSGTRWAAGALFSGMSLLTYSPSA